MVPSIHPNAYRQRESSQSGGYSCLDKQPISIRFSSNIDREKKWAIILGLDEGAQIYAI